MAGDRSSKQVIELPACGPDDPDGRRAAIVLGAYVHAEQAQVFRRLLWRRLAVIALVAWILEATTPLLPQTVFVISFLAFGAIGVTAAVAEWRTQKRLRALLDSQTNS